MAIRSDWVNGEQWNAADQNEVNAAVLDAQSITQKGQPLGYASLDATGKVPASQLPATGMQRVIASSNVPVTLPNSSNTDYVYFLGGTPGTPAGAGDSQWSNVTSLLQFNSSTTFDGASNPATWTANGSLAINTSTKKFGNSSLFYSTTGQYLSTSASSRFDIGAGTAFTAEFWVNPTDVSGNKAFLGFRNANTIGPILFGQTGSSLVIYIGNAALTAWEVNAYSPGTTYFIAGSWTHVALVGTGTELWWYINGVPVFGWPQPQWASANRPLFIGGDPWWAWHTGYLDEFRFTRTVARYTNAFNLATSEFLTGTPTAAVDPIYGNATLPTALNNKNVYTLRNVFTLPVTISTTAGQTIEGQSSYPIDPGETASFISDGSNWRIV